MMKKRRAILAKNDGVIAEQAGTTGPTNARSGLAASLPSKAHNMLPEFNLSGKAAIVTGGANGIGRAIALGLGRAGADIFLTARSDDIAAKEVVTQLRALDVRADHMLLDAQDGDAPERLLKRGLGFLGQADILVNNVAMTARTTILDITVEEYDSTLNVNLRFPFFLLQRFANELIKRASGGSVINVSSISAFKAISRLSAYQCSKAGLSMLSKSAAYELAPHGIRVNTISPGLTATKSNRDQWRDNPVLWTARGKDLPLGRSGRPDDFAGAAIFLASDASSWMTGADLVVDGGDAVI